MQILAINRCGLLPDTHVSPALLSVVSPMPTRARRSSMCAVRIPLAGSRWADDEVVTASAYLWECRGGRRRQRRWCDILHGRR